MSNEKDRLGNKLHDLERGREDQYFAQRDRELIEKLRQSKGQDQEAALREASLGRCPKCGRRLEARTEHGVNVDQCPECGGIWLNRDEHETLAKRESEGWLARIWRSR